jgi:hypothetical protein
VAVCGADMAVPHRYGAPVIDASDTSCRRRLRQSDGLADAKLALDLGRAC